MDNQAILSLLKGNLEKVNSVNDDYLIHLIEVSKAEIAREGIMLTETDEGYSSADGDLIQMYAAYLYRQRVTNSEGYQTAALYPQGVPYMLRLRLNNRLMEQMMEATS